MTVAPARDTIDGARPRRLGIGTLAAAALAIAAVTGMLLGLSGLFHGKVPAPGAAASTGETVGATEEIATVRRIRRPRSETAVGTVKPVHEVAVASKILAVIEEMRVSAGQGVRAGDVLVVLDDEALVARLQQAESAVGAARAAADRAQLDLARAQRLREQNAVTQAQLDEAIAAGRASQAELLRAGQAVEEARIVRSYATITAPITGVVVDKRAESGDTAAPGQVLVTLYDPTQMQLVASVREGLASRLKVGEEVPARLENLGLECHATVREIVPESQAATRTFQVKVTGPCPPGVTSGMFGRISVPLEDETLLVVPERAIRRVGQLTIVDLVRDGRAERRAIRTGRAVDGGREVLAGLHEGDRVVVGRTADGGGPGGDAP